MAFAVCAITVSPALKIVSAATPVPAANYNTALMEQLVVATRAPATAQYATTGTAFFVSGSGDLLTVAHVVRDCDSIELISDDLPATRATLVKANQGWDLALLRLAESPSTPPAILTFAPRIPHDQEGLSVVGYPVGSDMRHAVITPVKALDVDGGKAKAPPYVLVLDGRTEMGDSGAPLLDSAGQVVGLLKGGYELRGSENSAENKGGSRSIGPNHNLVDAFYRELGMGEPPVATTATSSIETSDIAERARGAVVRVVCWRAAAPN